MIDEEKCLVDGCNLMKWSATVFCNQHMNDYCEWVKQGKPNDIMSFVKAGGLRAKTIEDIEFDLQT